jgi:hypothetical protein
VTVAIKRFPVKTAKEATDMSTESKELSLKTVDVLEMIAERYTYEQILIAYSVLSCREILVTA